MVITIVVDCYAILLVTSRKKILTPVVRISQRNERYQVPENVGL